MKKFRNPKGSHHIEEIDFGTDDVIFFVTSPSWNVQLGDIDKDVPVGLYCSAIDMYEATGENEFKQYPYYIEIEIMAAHPSKKFYEGEGKPNQIGLIWDTHSYMGGVPVTDKFLSVDESNKKIIDQLKSKDAKVIVEEPQYGSVAARRGRGTEFSYPVFKTREAAEKFLKDLVEEYADLIMGIMVGFMLDMPINMVGDDGWSIIEKQVMGPRNR